MHSDIGIDIAAPAPLVFALARDTERWAVLLPHYVRSKGLDRDGWDRPVVEFIARRSFVPLLGLDLSVIWWSHTWNEPDALRLHFEHMDGVTRGMNVTWQIEPRGDGTSCRVTISHEFSPRVPGLARFVDRFFTRPIAGRTLATFKALAEAVAEVQGSEPSPPTKPRT